MKTDGHGRSDGVHKDDPGRDAKGSPAQKRSYERARDPGTAPDIPKRPESPNRGASLPGHDAKSAPQGENMRENAPATRRARRNHRESERARSEIARLERALESGVYLPPFRLAELHRRRGTGGLSRHEEQRLDWEKLRRRINGIVNRANMDNASECVIEMFNLNIVRGMGLVVRSLMRAQLVSLRFTPVYAAIAASLNTRIPELGELLLHRVVAQFKEGMDLGDRGMCVASVNFIAHLFNQNMADAVVPLEIMVLLADSPTNDAVELLVAMMRACGALLLESEPEVVDGIFGMLRNLVHEGEVDARVQYAVDGLFALRRREFDHADPVPAALDLVPEEESIVHVASLKGELETNPGLDFFHYDEEWEASELLFLQLRKEILGQDDALLYQDAGSEDEAVQSSPEPTDESYKQSAVEAHAAKTAAVGSSPKDMTEDDLVAFRRKVYLTVMSAASYEECAHKLASFMRQYPAYKRELCDMIIECCAQERTFLRYYGLLGRQFCFLDKAYATCFEDTFSVHYAEIHRHDLRKIRNMAKFYAFLLSADALPWDVLGVTSILREATSSSRIFLKYLFLELSESMTVQALKTRVEDPKTATHLKGLFPTEGAEELRDCINFFTAIDLGPLTDGMRESLKIDLKKKSLARANGDGDEEVDEGADAEQSSSASFGSLSSSSLSSSSSSYESESPRRDVERRFESRPDADRRRSPESGKSWEDSRRRERYEGERRGPSRGESERNTRYGGDERPQSPRREQVPRLRRNYSTQSFERRGRSRSVSPSPPRPYNSRPDYGRPLDREERRQRSPIQRPRPSATEPHVGSDLPGRAGRRGRSDRRPAPVQNGRGYFSRANPPGPGRGRGMPVPAWIGRVRARPDTDESEDHKIQRTHEAVRLSPERTDARRYEDPPVAPRENEREARLEALRHEALLKSRTRRLNVLRRKALESMGRGSKPRPPSSDVREDESYDGSRKRGRSPSSSPESRRFGEDPEHLPSTELRSYGRPYDSDESAGRTKRRRSAPDDSPDVWASSGRGEDKSDYGTRGRIADGPADRPRKRRPDRTETYSRSPSPRYDISRKRSPGPLGHVTRAGRDEFSPRSDSPNIRARRGSPSPGWY